jgi:hypothetical protein
LGVAGGFGIFVAVAVGTGVKVEVGTVVYGEVGICVSVGATIIAGAQETEIIAKNKTAKMVFVFI